MFPKIEWYRGVSNTPILRINGLTLPKCFEYIKHDRLYYAEKSSCVSFFFYENPGSGFDRDHYHLKLTDGTKITLIGPWSSNAAAMNANQMWVHHPSGTAPCLDAYPQAITLDLAVSLVHTIGVHLVCCVHTTLHDMLSQPQISAKHEQVLPWQEWKNLPRGTHFDFCPSLSPTEIKKPC